MYRVIAVILLAGSSSLAFAPTAVRTTLKNGRQADYAVAQRHPSSRLYEKDDKKKLPYDEGLRTKLYSETIAPWRAVRLFLYGALGSGAAVGGLLTLAGTAAVLSGARPDLELQPQLVNLAIDFGAVAAFVALFKWDFDRSRQLDTQVEEKLERKQAQKQRAQSMAARNAQLANLQLAVTTGVGAGAESQTVAGVRELQAGARQHMIVVIGPKKACKDALVGANLLKMDFSLSNVLVVPYEIGKDGAVDEALSPESLSSAAGEGFGDNNKPMYETQPYVARPVGAGWADYVRTELADAEAQNGVQARTEGIAVVVANSGKIIRRGVGKVPWRQMVQELESSVQQGEQKQQASLF